MIQKAESSPEDYPQFASTSASIGALLAAVKAAIQWTVAINKTMKICFGEVHAKLNKAMQIAMAAEACAKAGSLDHGVEISWTWTNCFMTQAACMMRSA